MGDNDLKITYLHTLNSHANTLRLAHSCKGINPRRELDNNDIQIVQKDQLADLDLCMQIRVTKAVGQRPITCSIPANTLTDGKLCVGHNGHVFVEIPTDPKAKPTSFWTCKKMSDVVERHCSAELRDKYEILNDVDKMAKEDAHSLLLPLSEHNPFFQGELNSHTKHCHTSLKTMYTQCGMKGGIYLHFYGPDFTQVQVDMLFKKCAESPSAEAEEEQEEEMSSSSSSDDEETKIEPEEEETNNQDVVEEKSESEESEDDE